MGNNVVSVMEYWARNFFSFNTVIIATITIGVLFILASGTYLVKLNMSDFKVSSVIIEEALWGLGLGIAMFFLQNVFIHLYAAVDSTDLGWQYSNAQFIVLFYCLYIVHRKIVVVFNAALPLYIYGLAVQRGQVHLSILPIIGLLVIMWTSHLIYKYNDQIIDDAPKYYLTQVAFGLSWWIVIKDVHALTAVDIFCLTLEFLISMTIVHFGNKKVRSLINQYLNLMQEVDTDALTGVYNRNSFNKVVEDVYGFYSTADAPLTMVMFDIDHFKEFNDTYGHQIGDEVLRRVAHRFSFDLVEKQGHGQLFRVGGEEFAIIFRGREAAECAKLMIEIRNDLVKETVKVSGQKSVGITISIGLSELRPTDSDFQMFYKRVDDYLYQSKRHNRNSITVEGKVESLN
jgi:diguanylate cyclase (GGDEF)-like protein